jgi:hypothetical protein
MGGYLPHIINSSFEDLHWPRSVPVTALDTKETARWTREVADAWDWPSLVTSSNCPRCGRYCPAAA